MLHPIPKSNQGIKYILIFAFQELAVPISLERFFFVNNLVIYA
jgi:hypothetical protein